ncbi:putative metal-binding protein DUF2103 [Orenia metallireducens]|jgi:hypothetical protein|uniref:Predicted metal-binding protein n=1 Tax=Orenia metallireducens TaxID=1413210 RepID=A0A285GWB2_9FIRM|nr:DUF2103 domain-containing protein [Orenia metallireducens]PRX31057.1 putative metal-binding protein DUF2103 [Orenia metallireducens]SNY27859.1 Predicted metal-binding protein [Orenia metallireducens]
MGKDNKYRANKIKQEHTIIEDILPLLEKVAELNIIKSIIPGRINRRGGSGIPPHLKLKYPTPSGIKILAKNSSSIQEVFVVTDDVDQAMELIKEIEFVK